jgi:hypothetical protein
MNKMIRFIFQRNAYDETKDDTIYVRYAGNKQAEVIYKYSLGMVSPSRYVLDRDELTAYLSSMLRLITIDTIPFKAVQIDFPMMPCVCLEPHRLSWEEQNIMTQVRLQFESWIAADAAANRIPDPPRAEESKQEESNLAEAYLNSMGIVLPH